MVIFVSFLHIPRNREARDCNKEGGGGVFSHQSMVVCASSCHAVWLCYRNSIAQYPEMCTYSQQMLSACADHFNVACLLVRKSCSVQKNVCHSNNGIHGVTIT
jgi:hypothetical protein